MSHICANDEYRSQVGVPPRVTPSLVVDVFSFHLQIFHWFIAPPCADISKVTAHERIQCLYYFALSTETDQ
jgi:hypothetical protein